MFFVCVCEKLAMLKYSWVHYVMCAISFKIGKIIGDGMQNNWQNVDH